MVHWYKKEWYGFLLSPLSCKLGSDKARRKENKKEKTIPFVYFSDIVFPASTKAR